ncbi:MAG: hypothetical protein NVS3B25_09750 [Hymenobacter sp.]
MIRELLEVCGNCGEETENLPVCDGCKAPPAPDPRESERWTFGEVCDAINVCESGHAPTDDGVACDFKSLLDVLRRNRAAPPSAPAGERVWNRRDIADAVHEAGLKLRTRPEPVPTHVFVEALWDALTTPRPCSHAYGNHTGLCVHCGATMPSPK